MKKYITSIMVVMLLISCSNNQQNNSELEIGSAMMDGTTEMTSIVAGDTSNQQIWLKYIQAHNDKNLDIISEINADDWEGYTADGSVVMGNEAHIEVLENWFKNADPKWKVKWMIANAAKNKDGVIEQWLTTGNEYTDLDENGDEIFEHNVHDILFESGKIKKINVYKRAKAQEEAEFSY